MRSLNITRWVAVALLATVLIVPAWMVYIARSTIVTVAGGSMAPTLHRGDVVVISPVDSADLAPGMIVTAKDDATTYYTHRIDSIDADGGLHLKGDANEAVDLSTRYPDQLLGSVQLILTPPLGDVLVQLQQWPLRISVLVTIFGLAFLPLRDVALERERRRTDSSTVVDNEMILTTAEVRMP